MRVRPSQDVSECEPTLIQTVWHFSSRRQELGQGGAARQAKLAAPESLVNDVPIDLGSWNWARFSDRPPPVGPMKAVRPAENLPNSDSRWFLAIAFAAVVREEPGQRGESGKSPQSQT